MTRVPDRRKDKTIFLLKRTVSGRGEKHENASRENKRVPKGKE